MNKWLLLILLTRTKSDQFDSKSKWYTRYQNGYPEYCSTEEQMNQREIPPVQKPPFATPDQHTKLLHVTSIIRHGARTPYADYKCWNGWEYQSWDCNLNSLSAPPSKFAVEHLELDGTDLTKQEGEGLFFLFEKRFDSLQDPPQLRNSLNGTCQTGQLLLRGYVQELHNGKMLRRTYVRDDIGMINDDGTSVTVIPDEMVLFDLNKDWPTRPYEEPYLFYRTDDDERTIMSGQVLIRGMFEDLLEKHSAELGNQSKPVIRVHTADRIRDILSPNPEICPRLRQLWDEAVHSREYAERFVKSDEAKAMKRLMTELGGDFQDSAQDCIMTAICNDKELPEILNDYGEESTNSQNYLQRLSAYSYLPFNYALMYNDAAYSRLAMGPMWVSILSNILPHIQQIFWKSMFPLLRVNDDAPKLALFSAHDTTIMSLMAALGKSLWNEADWPPYASLLIIEIHQMSNFDKSMYPSERAFRLLYNGKVLTEKVDGCPVTIELCDISHFLKIVSSVASNDRECGEKESRSEKQLDHIKSFLLTKDGLISASLLIIFSASLGGVVTYYFLTKNPLRSIRNKYNRAPSVQYEETLSNRMEKSTKVQIDSYGAANSLDEDDRII